MEADSVVGFVFQDGIPFPARLDHRLLNGVRLIQKAPVLADDLFQIAIIEIAIEFVDAVPVDHADFIFRLGNPDGVVAGSVLSVPLETRLGPDQFQPQPGTGRAEDGRSFT